MTLLIEGQVHSLFPITDCIGVHCNISSLGYFARCAEYIVYDNELEGKVHIYSVCYSF